MRRQLAAALAYRAAKEKADHPRSSETVPARPAANQEIVIHTWTIRFGVGFRRRFEEREFRWDRTNLFSDLAEESFFQRLRGPRMPADEIPDGGIETLRRGSSFEKQPSIANE